MLKRKRLEYYQSKLNEAKKLVGESDTPRSISVPSYIFSDRSVSFLEAVIEYLKDNRGLKYSQIARLLNRDDRTVWTSYKRAKTKRDSPSYIKTETYVKIPLSVFMDRCFSGLEAVSLYLKDNRGLKYSQIARLLNRDDRTIWTCYNRAIKKREVDNR